MNIDFGVKDITIGVMIIVKGVMINALGIMIIAMGVIIITMGVMIISYVQYFFIININISFLIFIISSILLVCPKNILLYFFIFS